MRPRIKYYDGIRGVAALWVAVIHFHAAFYWPELKTGDISLSDLAKRLVLNGDLCVFIFWLLSGIVISYSMLTGDSRVKYKVMEFPIKRYFRLVLPIFIISSICFLILRYDLFYFRPVLQIKGFMGNVSWLNRFYNFSPDLFAFLKITFFDVFLIGNSNYNPPLWTIGPELFGPILIIFLLYIYNDNKNKYTIYFTWVLFFFIGGMSNYSFYYYILFIFGLWITEAARQTDEAVQKLPFLISSYLFNNKVAGWIYLFVSVLLEFLYQQNISHFIAFFALPLRAIAIILIVKNTEFLKNIFSFNIFQFFGKISYAVYLLHLPVILSVVSYLYMLVPDYFSKHIHLLLLIYLSIIILLSFLFYKIFEEKSIIWAKRLAEKIIGLNMERN